MSGSRENKNFTMIANELLEVIQDYKFTTNQLKIILVIWRQTYGYQRENYSFALSYLEKTTNLTRARISESIQKLIEDKVVLEIHKGGGRKSKVLAFNGNFTEWKTEKYARANSTTSIQNDTSRGLQNDTSRSLQDDTQYIKGKEKLKKKKYMDLSIHESPFLKIYLLHYSNYFSKEHKKVSEENLNLILDQLDKIADQIDIEEFEEMVLHHFNNLPSKNDGNILAFIPAIPRYMSYLNSDM